ncbi:MAG: efflux RND transporter periplasmic adaptor subunit [Candidatus Hydrogenedentes bacterium]|nr:efflux RND transporter periplasmic adaptor subunit [Candidatus Hydrogenedentota bacterium]
MKRILGGLILAVLAAVAVYTLMPQPLPVEFGQVEQRTVREYITEEAKVRLADEYVIDAPVSGTAFDIAWDVGDVVQAGEVLVKMDTDAITQQILGLEARIRQSRAQESSVDILKPKVEDLSSASVRVKEASDAVQMTEKEKRIVGINFEEAQKEYTRAKKLVGEGVASQSMLDEAERAFKGLEQQMASAEIAAAAARKSQELAQLAASRVEGSVDDNEYMREVYAAEVAYLEAQKAILQSDLNKMEIKAPVTGPVLEKYMETQRVLIAGTPLLKMGDLNSMDIECDVLSEEVTRITVGDPVDIYGKALQGATIPGKVKRIYPSAFRKISSLGIEQQRVKVLIEFDAQATQLLTGTRVDVRIITAEAADVLAVPERATFRRDNAWYVFTVQGGRAVLSPIEVGLKNDEWAQLEDHLQAGDTIVAEPKNDLVDGMRVVPL